MIPLGQRIRTPRYSVHGEVLATFWPKGCNRYNCRIGFLVARKRRGLRLKSRAWKWKRDCAIDEAFRFLGWKE